MRSLLRRLLVSPARNLDLVGLWLLLVVITTIVPLNSVLARPDLVPWITLCVCVVAALRGRTLGDARHPSLSPRRVRWAAMAGVVGRVTIPLASMAWYDAGGSTKPSTVSIAVALSVVAAAGVALGHIDGRVAWKPPSQRSWWRWALRVSLLIAFSFTLGLLGAVGPAWDERFVVLPGALLLGVQLLGVGAIEDRIAVRWQREAAGRKDGKAYRAPLFRKVLALLGPSSGLVLLYMALSPVITVGFEQAAVIALHVLAWGAVLWPPRIPVGVSCVLHEVVPTAGRDPSAKADAPAFARPPTGALRLDPLGIRRLRVVHHWVVPVLDPRIEDLDDPVRPLWPGLPTPAPAHVLGVAAFEPEEKTQVPQWHTITIRLDSQEDVASMAQGTVQTRRMVIMRAYVSRGSKLARPLRTYRWDPEVPAGSLQVVDATTTQLSLQNGDIIVLSTEGVARAFEVEMGAAVYDWSEIGHVRPPQLEDYVGVS